MNEKLTLKQRGYQPLAIWQIAVSAAVFVALMVLTAIGEIDLDINKALANDNSAYGWFFAKFGEAATYILIPIGATFVFRGIPKVKKYLIFRIVFLAAVIAGNFVFLNWLYGRVVFIKLLDGVKDTLDMSTLPYIFQKTVELYSMLKLPALVVATAGFTAVDLLLTRNLSEETSKKLMVFGIYMLATILIAVGLVSAILKPIWARERFRVMQEINDFSGFRRWWQPAAFINTEYRTEEYMAYRNTVDQQLGFNGDAFKSFPSGHTVAASMCFVVMLLPDLFKKLKKYRQLFYIVPAIVTAAVAISRVVNRAHFLSDVTVGGFTGFLAACLLRRLVWTLFDLETYEFRFFKKAPIQINAETVANAEEEQSDASEIAAE